MRPEAAELSVTKASHALFMPSARSCIVGCSDCHVSTKEEGRTRDAAHYLAQVVLCEVLVGPEADILQEMHVAETRLSSGHASLPMPTNAEHG